MLTESEVAMGCRELKRKREEILARRSENAIPRVPEREFGRTTAGDSIDEAALLGLHHQTEAMRMHKLVSDAKTLEEIEHALRAYEDGTFGKCRKCRRKVPIERIVVVYALICVRCADTPR